jgi:ADP-ribosylglycohydrolase
MRVSAVGWLFDTLEETERVAAISATITHNHPEGIKGAQATAAAIFLARTGKSKYEIRDYIEKTYGYDLHKTWEYWHPIYHWEDSCQGTVPQAVIAFLDSTDFEDAIRKAVSLGGDSDTLACITGGIAEAFYRQIPKEMVDHVQALLPQAFVDILSEM